MDYCYKCMEKLADGVCPDCGHVDLEHNPHHLAPGTVLKEKYLIGASIGAGGFGITYIGRDLVLDIRIAVKEYFPNQFSIRNSSVSSEVTITAGRSVDATVTSGKYSYEKSMERFLAEARTIAKFEKDSGIVKVKDCFEANNTAYIIMEYVDGLTLKEYLETKGSFDAVDIIAKTRPVMESLSRVHEKGLVHRDISPDNIKLQTDGCLKLLDFGAARFVSADLDKTVTSMTKAGYAPEEQYRSGGEQGPWTDVYALCATIYKCITGVTPPDAPQRLHNKTRGKDDIQKPSELGAAVSPDIESVILRGMAVLQEDRYQNMLELLTAFDEKSKNEISGGSFYGGDEPTPDPPKPEIPEPKKAKEPNSIKNVKEKPPRKQKITNKAKNIFKIAGIAVAAIALLVACVFVISLLTERANMITIAGQNYDKSETYVSITDKILTPDDINQLSKMTSLNVLTLKNCGLNSDVMVVLSNLENLRSIDLSANPGITDCSALANRTELKYLYLNGTGIQDISFVAELTGLIELEVNDCQISDISPIKKCEALSRFCIGGNSITDLAPMERLLKLKYVDISRNEISSLAGMANCAVLETVNFSDNEITSIDILAKSSGTLKIADVSRNLLNNSTFARAFDDCPVLETLIADDIGIIGAWDVVDLPNIVNLSMADNNIERLAFGGGRGTRLTNLNLSGNNNLNKVSIPDATAWKVIDLSDTALINQSLTLSASSVTYAQLALANCAAIDLQDIPSEMSYSLLDVRSDTVFNAALIAQITSNELLINYSEDKDRFDTDAIAASKINKIGVYNAPLDMQEKIIKSLQSKTVYFDDEGAAVNTPDLSSSLNNNIRDTINGADVGLPEITNDDVTPTTEPTSPAEQETSAEPTKVPTPASSSTPAPSPTRDTAISPPDAASSIVTFTNMYAKWNADNSFYLSVDISSSQETKINYIGFECWDSDGNYLKTRDGANHGIGKIPTSAFKTFLCHLDGNGLLYSLIGPVSGLSEMIVGKTYYWIAYVTLSDGQDFQSEKQSFVFSTDGTVPKVNGRLVLQYDANGGEGAPENHSVVKEDTGGGSCVISQLIPKKDGYTFLCWYLWNNPDFIYYPGENFDWGTGDSTTDTTLVLYAQWIEN